VSKENDIALLDRYIRNECTANEVEEIQNRLKTDDAFASEYETLQDVGAGARLDDLNSKMHLLQGFEKKIGSSAASESSIPDSAVTDTTAQPEERKTINLRYPAIMAAILLIALSAYFYMENNKVYDFQDFQQYVMHENTRSQEASTYTPEQQAAFNKYVIQDFNGAIPELRKLWLIDKDELAGYYLGISYWATGKKLRAKTILDEPQFKDYKKPY